MAFALPQAAAGHGPGCARLGAPVRWTGVGCGKEETDATQLVELRAIEGEAMSSCELRSAVMRADDTSSFSGMSICLWQGMAKTQ